MEILFFGAINPAFLNVSTLLYSTSDFIHVGIVALALTLVIITGGIDLSIGAVMGLSAITLGLLWVAGVNIWVACFCALGAGAITGIINSVAIQIAQVNPLVITLGSSFLFSGASLVLSGLGGASGYEGISGFDDSFVELANLEVLGMPFPLVIFIVANGCLYGAAASDPLWSLHLSDWSETRVATRYAGIPQFRTLTIAYALTGMMAALSGLVLASYFGSARSDFGFGCSDAGHHRCRSGRNEYLWRFWHHPGHGLGCACGWVFSNRSANHRRFQSHRKCSFRSSAGGCRCDAQPERNWTRSFPTVACS